MAQLCTAQKLLGERIGKLYTNIKKTSKSRFTKAYLETRLETVGEYWDTYKKQHNDILTKVSGDILEQVKYDPSTNFDNTEEIYLELKTILKECLDECNSQQKSSSTSLPTDSTELVHTRKAKLPPISIPKFSGNYLEWFSFRDIFLSLIHNDDRLTSIEKHHYLKSSISGEAEQLLKHFALTSANYEMAWKTLEDRYDNKRIIVNNILNRLLTQRKMTVECSRGLKEILDTTQECLYSLNNIGIETNTWDAIVIHIVVSKLDTESHKLWEQSLGSLQDIPSFASLASHLESRFRALEVISNARRAHTTKPTSNSPSKNSSLKTFTTEFKTTCTYCSQSHYICHCKDFATLSTTERRNFIKNNNLCFNCLVKGHSVNQCRQSTTCRKCGRRHHTLLHITNPDKILASNTNSTDQESPSTSCNTISLNTETESNQVILATAQIAVKGINGATYILRALIDQGSQASFITEAASQLLRLERIPVNGKITGISDSAVVKTRSMVKFTIHSKKALTPLLEVHAYVLKRLTSLLPSREFSSKTWPSSMQLDLADPNYHKPGSIDVLLGADVHAQIMQEGIHKHGSLVALNSSLGWLISGRVSHTSNQNPNVIVTHFKFELDQLLRQFWEIEENLPRKNHMTQLEIQCEEHFKNTHTRNNSGRYIVRLPFKEDTPINLGDSKSIALNRLQHMEKRFAQKPELKEQYKSFMLEYLAHGHMELVPERELNTKKCKYYLPHHAVLKPTSLSTKLRVVFDGSAALNKGKSLNEVLLTGPSLLQDIRDLITRWRQHKFCLVADIQKMYRQILISREDIDYQRILWRNSTKEQTKEYRLLTLSYGTSCAPFVAVRTLHQLAEDEKERFPREAEIIKSDIYMDDLMTGSSTEDDAINLQRGITELLSRGGFPLHKWSSNSKTVLNQIPNKSKELQSEVNIKVKDTIKALGITWNSQTDNFELKLNLEYCSSIITKRNVLSAIAKTFDPLGWLAPSIITLKIFMQKLWLANLDWDEEVTHELKSEWFTYLDNYTNVQNIKLSRWLSISSTTSQIELHGFSDASCAAYAGVLYLRVWDGDHVNVHLVVAKARVAPVKQISVPRLELCGAVLLANMIQSIKTLLKINDDHIFAWTDSTIVLSWLRKTPNTWTTFVANRTAEILTVTNNNQWHHVDSVNNPADLASRGVSPSELKQQKLWWNGPDFLRQPVEIVRRNCDLPETEIELKGKIVTHICTNVTNFGDIYLTKFSSLLKLIHVTAYCLRFINNCRMKANLTKEKYTPYLTASEIKNGLNVCIKLSQNKYFSDEICLLSQGKCVNRKSSLYTLNPYLDQNKLLRVGGRLINAEVSTYLKSPIILSNHCHLSQLIVSNAHEKTLHGGNQLTLNYIRQKFWIIRVKHLVKTAIRKCIPCFKFRATPNLPIMGNLPECRVKPDRPFRTSGVDFAGPFTLKLYPGRCKKTSKAYICLFVCTVTKALHLEVVSDLTSAAFLAAFKRFTARRGQCKDIWSDCGTNFKGASRELDLAFKSLKSQVVTEIAELLANDQTTWHFIPPSAPHFGGLWESGVKSVKNHLKRVIGPTNLTFEEFSTLLTQVEACVNSRPLTLISSGPDEPPLTPGHFLIGEPPIAVAEENLMEIHISPLDRWHMIQKMVQCLWHRWQLEYLTNLQNRYKWAKHCSDIQLGTVVLVKDDKLPPGKWLLGRVVIKHPGADGITRVVTLQYKDKIFKRPVAKLCPLPLNE